MITGSSLLLSVALFGSGATTDFATAAEIGASAGLIPLAPNEAAEPSFQSSLGAFVGMRVASRRSTFILSYGPRLQLQVPSPFDNLRPLLLHRAGASYATELSRRTRFQAGATGTMGEVSYMSLAIVFDPGTGTFQREVARLATAHAFTGLSYRTSERNVLSSQVGGGVQISLDDTVLPDPDDPSGVVRREAFPSSYDVSLTLRDDYTLTEVDQLTFSVRGGYLGPLEEPDPGAILANELVNGNADAAWTRRLSLVSSARVSAGVAGSYSLDLDTFSFFPTASVAYTTRFSTAEWIWSTTTEGGIRGFLDRVTATYRAQGFAGWNLIGSPGGPWSTGVDVSASTSLTEEPIVPATYETNLAVTLPTTYRFNQNAGMSFGARMVSRTPHLAAPGTLTPQREYSAFIGLRVNFGTDAEEGAWLR